jgi:hypothetical protein
MLSLIASYIRTLSPRSESVSAQHGTAQMDPTSGHLWTHNQEQDHTWQRASWPAVLFTGVPNCLCPAWTPPQGHVDTGCPGHTALRGEEYPERHPVGPSFHGHGVSPGAAWQKAQSSWECRTCCLLNAYRMFCPPSWKLTTWPEGLQSLSNPTAPESSSSHKVNPTVTFSFHLLLPEALWLELCLVYSTLFFSDNLDNPNKENI